MVWVLTKGLVLVSIAEGHIIVVFELSLFYLYNYSCLLALGVPLLDDTLLLKSNSSSLPSSYYCLKLYPYLFVLFI